MNALKFLEITKGADLVLNSGSELGMEFSAVEIASSLDGSSWKPSEQFTSGKDMRVVVGQPANYPVELIEALKRSFKTRGEVKRVWLVHFCNPARDGKPRTLIGLEVTGNRDAISRETGMIAKNIAIPDPPGDLIQVTGHGGIDEYFLKSSNHFISSGCLDSSAEKGKSDPTTGV